MGGKSKFNYNKNGGKAAGKAEDWTTWPSSQGKGYGGPVAVKATGCTTHRKSTVELWRKGAT
eukprot:2427381-Amphidinium_carterae.1